jgi:hypothetical protein
MRMDGEQKCLRWHYWPKSLRRDSPTPRTTQSPDVWTCSPYGGADFHIFTASPYCTTAHLHYCLIPRLPIPEVEQEGPLPLRSEVPPIACHTRRYRNRDDPSRRSPGAVAAPNSRYCTAPQSRY